MLLVTTKVVAVALPTAVNSVIAPDVLFRVTPVVRLVICVTAPPEPVAYPIPAAPELVSAPVAARDVPVAAPMFGVVSVGFVPNTSAPVPVSSVQAAAMLTLENVTSIVATPVPNPEMPVETGRPVQFVRMPDAGVPRAGVTSVGLVAKTRAPVPVSSVSAAARFALDGVPKNAATPAAMPEMPVLIDS